ncbi:AraC-type DNA-binding protein [Caloramator quimbayensis]|uniref:AraC-type DNA-binding protein n=1 Tax=Caloramator quimbayensis TaxID=1147123 RepID=A0A1T4XV10_9CLOT|nr:AraC family transcriptional regulator [Caloramator quimbayensis]SKA92881.1 AraC-type DNA-binding protein [Caloramator quimbayensis]
MQHNVLLINRNFSDINPLIFGWEDCEKNHSFGPAIREYYLIHYIVSGKGKFIVDNKEYKLSKGWMFLIRPDITTYYVADSYEPWSYIWIGFDGGNVLNLINHTGLLNNDVLYCPDVESVFIDMKQSKESLDYAEILLCSKIYEMFYKLYNINNKSINMDNPSIYVKRAKDYIKAKYMNDISINEISNMLGIDRRYFYRIFKNITGKSPQDYIIATRLEKAIQLLLNSSYSISEISQNVGYNDVYNFSKLFKKKYGVSPLNYRKNNR